MNQTEKKKKAILAVTFELLNQKRIKEITVDEIAQKAEVSKVTLFKYFQSKNQLMNLVIITAFKNMVTEIEAILQSPLDFTSTYEAITQLKVKQIKQYSPTFSENLMLQYSESPDFFDPDTLSIQTKIYEELFNKGQKEGKIAQNYSKDDFLFILHLFSEGMKGLPADVLLEKVTLISQFFIKGWQ